MKEKDLKHRLQQTFDFSIWKEILPLFFKKIDYFSSPENLFTENDKVIEGKQIGTVKLDDGKQLAIFIVEVADSISIVRNRQGLREIAAKHIDQNIIHGALAFFYNKNQVDYRFSFIAKEASLDLETGELIKGETKPKRYTYLLGGNEACTTPAKRMLVLVDKREKGEVNIKELKEVFSVEALNKDFFKSYKAHYEKFAKHLADESNPFRAKLIDTEKETKDKEEKPIRDFVKKLLGRIVFLQFLEKKGWMGCDANIQDWTGGNPRFMYQLFEDFSKPEKFHSQCLTKLFFETLNTKRPNDIFEVQGLNRKLNGSRVPYLNGGLFEPEKNKATVEIDFPSEFFQELLEFFDQYNFTIDENRPDDHEVGIDPEMLGHIFENLLEDNRDKGAFYTPKEIVQYMCKESLIQYLLNTFQEQKDIEDFIRFHSVSPFLAEKENAILLNQKLDDIKVCDPAIGSGAFPIGMLQEIFEAKRFIYPYLKTNQDFKPAEVKKNIIQHSIYGVDLEKGAVDIAQLRFWLSLVVDELKPHPLPNLDYKIMQGNSLLESFEGVDLSKMGKTKSDVRIVEPERDLFGNMKENQMKMTFSKSETTEKIQQLIKRFFSIEKAEDKKAIRDEINYLVLQHIEYNIELRENQLNRFINEAGNPNNLNKNAKKKYDGYVADLDKIQATKTNLLKIQETDERPYFLWHLYFMDVFEKGGFDVMIGNPPYIQLQSMGKETDILENLDFKTFSRRGDIYCLFYEKGFELLKNKGTLVFITSNKWMRGGYGKSLREFFSQVNTKRIIDLGPGIFHSATVDTNIYLGQKSSFENIVKGIAIENRSLLEKLGDDNLIAMTDVNSDAWIVLDKNELLINQYFEQNGKPLREWNIKINFGIKTGFNEAYLIDEETKDELINSDIKSGELIKPLARGRDIERFAIEESNLWIIIVKYGASEYLEEKYASIYHHLLKFKEQLEKRGQCTNKGGQGQHHWLELDNNPSDSYLTQFINEKVVWKRVGSIMRFAYSDEEMYCLDSTCIATGEKIKYLTAVLNSKAGLYQLFKTSPQTGTGDQIISVQALEPLLVHYPSDEVEAKFNLMVDYILFIKKQKAPILEKVSNETISRIFEDIVDQMVYELYFEDHMKQQKIDVMQFINFEDITKVSSESDKVNLIQKKYYEFNQKDNELRNRLLLSYTRSPDIIKRINDLVSK